MTTASAGQLLPPYSETGTAQERSRRAPPLLHITCLGLAVVLWVLTSLPRINPSNMSDLGLISVLPVTFFVAVGLVIVGFAFALSAPQHRPLLIGGYLLLLFVILQATVPLVYPEPRFDWTYKHVGVIQRIQAVHSLNRGLDIYQNWPGFFSGTAALSDLTGIDPLRLAVWAPFFFSGLNTLAVRFAIRPLTTNPRHLYLAVFVYMFLDWTGQTYLSPQAFAFALSTVAVGLVLNYVPMRGKVRWRLRRRLWSRESPPDLDVAVQPARLGLVAGPAPELAVNWAYVVILAVAAAVVISHQLTPIMLVAGLGALVLLRRSPWWLPVSVAVMTAGWFWLARDYLAQHFPHLFSTAGSVSQNASGAGLGIGSMEHYVVVWATRILSVLVWSLAVGGTLRNLARRDVPNSAVAAVLAFTPIALIFGQSYGGEAIYRVYLFSLPWCAYLASGLLLSRSGQSRRPNRAVVSSLPEHERRKRNRGGMVAVALGAILMPLFLLANFGLDRYTYVRPAEVQAAQWFDQNSAPGAILVGINHNFPLQLGASYGEHYLDPWHWGATLEDNPAVNLADPAKTNMPALVASLRSIHVPQLYVLVSPGQEAFAAINADAPPGAVNELGQMLVTRAEFRIVFYTGDVYLLRLLPAATKTSV